MIKEPFIAHSELTHEIYVVVGKEKYCVTEQAIKAVAAIKALEHEPTKDEVILTKKEYGELVSSEYDNGYATGYREALEQEPILDKIRAEIKNKMETIIGQYDSTTPMYDRPSHKIERNKAREECIEIIDKYRQEG